MENILKYLLENKEIINLISVPLSLLALILAFVTFLITIKTFVLKKGINIRCSYTLAGGVDCDDNYISDITLENRKDKSVIIFSIYMKLGYNYYLELENFESKPLIIKAFEAYSNHYKPIIFYSTGSHQIKINNLLTNEKISKKIVLYTSDGKYEINANIPILNPSIIWFKNYSTFIIAPYRLSLNNQVYGKNVKYVVEFIDINNEKSYLKLFKDSYSTSFKYGINISKKLLSNKEKLENYFYKLIDNKTLNDTKIVKVYDFEQYLQKELNESDFNKNIIQSKKFNFLQYFIFGKIRTILDKMKSKIMIFFRNNKKIKFIKSLFK